MHHEIAFAIDANVFRSVETNCFLACGILIPGVLPDHPAGELPVEPAMTARMVHEFPYLYSLSRYDVTGILC